MARVSRKVDSLPRILFSGILNALLLPTLLGGQASRHELFPGNGPLWSLSFEMVANLIWAAMGPWLRTQTLALFVILAGVTVTTLTVRSGTANYGFDVATIPFAIARVCFGFALGVLIYRAYRSDAWPQWLPTGPATPMLLGFMLFAVLAFPHIPSISSAAVDIAALTVILPALVVLGVAQGRGGHFGKLLGELSYPLYVIHFPVLLLASGLHQTILKTIPSINIGLGAAAVSIVLSFIASRLYDIPLRRWLSNIVWPEPPTSRMKISRS